MIAPFPRSSAHRSAFTFADFLVVLAVLTLLTAIAIPMMQNKRDESRKSRCMANLKDITHAGLTFAEDNAGKFPDADPAQKTALWWFYKEQVKGYIGLRKPSSSSDEEFGCPSDRGYDDGKPFRLSPKFDYNSYCYNGVNLPGMPNIAGRVASSIKDPHRTLLMMEWTAHAPLSWHDSRTGKRNEPFYNDAKSVVGYVDGSVDFIPIYYDGINAAYTRDPIPGYGYKYSGD